MTSSLVLVKAAARSERALPQAWLPKSISTTINSSTFVAPCKGWRGVYPQDRWGFPSIHVFEWCISMYLRCIMRYFHVFVRGDVFGFRVQR